VKKGLSAWSKADVQEQPNKKESRKREDGRWGVEREKMETKE